MMSAGGPVVQACSLCGGSGRVRCCVCKAWYCSPVCQANHWPVHRRECVPLPGLEWPDGSRYEGQLEDGARGGQLEIEHVSDEESTSMKDLTFVGRARIENIQDVAPKNSQPEVQVREQQTVSKNVPINKNQEVLAEKVPQISPKTSSSSLPPSAAAAPVEVSAVDIRSKADPGGAKTVSKPVESAPISAKPVAVAVKPVPTPAKLVSNAIDPVKSAPTSEVKSVTPPSKAAPTPAKTASAPVKAVPTPTPAVAATPVKAAATIPVVAASSPAKPPAISSKPVTTQITAQTKPDVPQVSAVKQSEQSSAAVYLPTYQSTTLPAQVPPPPGKLSQIVLPVEDLVSPANFCVRLASDDAPLMKMLETMNESPPPTVQGWTVGRRETVAAYFKDIWYRGLAVKKSEGMFSIYLLDFGGALVNVAPDQLRPLPASLSNTPAVMYQVCLAGVGPTGGEVWGEEVGQLMGEIVNSDIQYKLGVEFLGQVEGGRWLVKLRGIEDEEDIGNMMLEGGLVEARVDSMMKTKDATIKEEKKVAAPVSKPLPFSTSNIVTDSSSTIAVVPRIENKIDPVTDPSKVKAVTNSTKASSAAEPIKAKPVVEPTTAKTDIEPTKAKPAGPKISRGVLPVNTTTVVGVCFLETPDKFYVCPSSCIEQFMTILSSAQSAPPGLVSPVVGSSCLAMDEDCWYRAEMVKLSADKTKATLFLLDYGKTVQAPTSALRPIPSSLATIPGLVCLVTLRGVKSGEAKWSPEQIAGALLVLDVGGEIQFKVKNVEVDKEFETIVSMEDLEGNEVADLMVETGIAEKDDVAELKLVLGTIAPGQHQLLVLSAISPMEINLCSQAQFLHFSDNIVPMVEQAASKAEKVLSLVEGDIVLACEDQVWYRAIVISLLPGDDVMVKLVDLAIMATVSKERVRAAKVDLMKEPVVAVSCCLDTWVDEDRKLALEKWGDKMEGILEQYSEVDVEVVNMMESQAKVKILKIEEKLGKKEVSRAEMLKMKLKMKK